MFKRIAMILVTGVALTSQTVVHAAPIVYSVNRTVGAFGTIIGTIETDGTLGTLNSGNIIDWNLSLNADSNLSTVGQLLGPSSGNNSSITLFPNTAITATTAGSVSTLFVNFGVASGEYFQIATGDYSVVWQMQPGIPFQDELVRESGPESPIQEFVFHGPVTQALGTASVVPLPAAGWLFLTGLGTFGVLARRQQKNKRS